MKIIINDDEHIIVYIEYQDGLPFDVKTIFYVPNAKKPYWRLVDWDFFPNNGQKDNMRYYESGGGGSHKSIQSPQWADGYTGKYWMHQEAKFKGKVKNGKRLKNPKQLPAYYLSQSATHINPFLCAEGTYSKEYCEMCGHESTEFCDEHKYMDDHGNERYLHNKEYV